MSEDVLHGHDLIEPQDALARMKAVADISGGDTESAHIEADDILLGLLAHFGQHEIVKEFDRCYRWYA